MIALQKQKLGPALEALVHEAGGQLRIASHAAHGADRVSGEPGQRGGRRAAAHYVADRDHPSPVDREGVIEIAPDLVDLSRGPVHGRDLEAAQVGELGWRESSLEDMGDLGVLPANRAFSMASPRPARSRLRSQVGLVEAP